jgi:hypothetical protein
MVSTRRLTGGNNGVNIMHNVVRTERSHMVKEKFRRLAIDRKANGWDELVCRLGDRGWTGNAIARETNLTVGQVYGRLRKYGISASDARHGLTKAERDFLASCRRLIGRTRAPQT